MRSSGEALLHRVDMRIGGHGYNSEIDRLLGERHIEVGVYPRPHRQRGRFGARSIAVDDGHELRVPKMPSYPRVVGAHHPSTDDDDAKIRHLPVSTSRTALTMWSRSASLRNGWIGRLTTS